MRRIACVMSLALVATSLSAQEVEVYAATANPAPYSDRASGLGIAFAGFIHLSDVFSPRNAVGRSDKRLGVRFGFGRLWSTGLKPLECPTPLGGMCVPAHEVQARLNLLHAVLLFEPYLSERMSLDVGLGAVNYRYSGDTNNQETGLVASVRVARRVTQNRPWWVMLEYARHGSALGIPAADGTGPIRLPDNSLRAGLVYRAPLRMTPRPQG